MLKTKTVSRAKKRTSRYPGLSLRESNKVNRLRKRLRAILPNGEIKSLILYGSKARGQANRRSDIDLLLVYDDVTPEQEAALKDFADEPGGELLPIHLLVYRADELQRELGKSPLFYNVADHGIVIQGAPVPQQDIDRPTVARVLISKALKNLKTAQLIFESENYNTTISTACYAALYAADAAFASKGLVAQSHTGTETLLTLHFIRKGLIPESFKGLMGRARKVRIQADYHWQVEFNRDDAEYWLNRAKEFVSLIEASLETWLAEPPNE